MASHSAGWAIASLNRGLRQIRSRHKPLARPGAVCCQSRRFGIHYVPMGTTRTHKDVLKDAVKKIWAEPDTTLPEKKALVADSGRPAKYVTLDGRDFHAVFLRDACTCALCVDPSTRQKNFQTTAIPEDISDASVKVSPNGGYDVTWNQDIPGFPATHISHYSERFLLVHSSRYELWGDRMQASKYIVWDKERITDSLEFVEYEDYMTTNQGLFRALLQLYRFGLLLIRGVPSSEKSVEDIALRIGNLRDTFYGRTWDVKSVPKAKNVAYTAQFLGLHMDLLYMANPPGYQFLHCLRNTCEGGASLFTDAFYAASRLSKGSLFALTEYKVPYHYRNAGEHYYFQHPVIELGTKLQLQRNEKEEYDLLDPWFANVNYSPPFQAAHYYLNEKHGGRKSQGLPRLLKGMREFASLVEDPNALLEYRLQEGECVIFNNRRILHGRRQFDTAVGERWLKGAYIDADVFMSRGRVLRETMSENELLGAGQRRQWVYSRDKEASDAAGMLTHEDSRLEIGAAS